MKHLILALIIFVAAAGLHSSQPVVMTVYWEKVQTTAAGGQFPAWTSYMKPVYDPTSATTLWYNARSTSSIIYSTDIFSYKAGFRTWTRLGGTGSAIATCGTGSTATDIGGNSILPWPSDRHPIEQFTIDTTRQRLYMAGGVCSGQTPNDTWFYSLNPDPRANRWTRLRLVMSRPFRSAAAWTTVQPTT